MNDYPDKRNAFVIFIENTKLLWHWLENIRNIMCPAFFRNAATSEQAMAS